MHSLSRRTRRGDCPSASLRFCFPISELDNMQATALRRMSSMGQAQLQSKSKSLAPPDTGSGLCPQHASLPAKLGQWLCHVNETVERACQLRRLQSFEGAGMTGNVESGPVHPRFAVPKPQLASGTRPPTRVGVLWTTTVGSVATSSGQWPSYRTAGEWESLGLKGSETPVGPRPYGRVGTAGEVGVPALCVCCTP